MAVEIATIVERMQTAGHSWESALDAHALAPPDAGFPARLRALSLAAAEQAEAFDLAAQGGLGWRSRAVEPDFTLAPELAPGMTRPGPEDLWASFDEAVAALAQALSGSSPAELAATFRELSQAASALVGPAQQLYRAGRVAAG